MRSLVVVVVTVALSGCYAVHEAGGSPPPRDGGPIVDPGRDGGPIDPPPPIDGGPVVGACERTLFLLGAWDLPEATGSSAPGMDLDGVISTGSGGTCVDLTPDYVGTYSGDPGVDNAYSALVPQITMLSGRAPREALAPATDAGALLYAVELRGVDHPTDDPSVEVILHRATPIGGYASMGGIPAPDQRIALSPVSSGRGSLAGGWLRAELASFTLEGLPEDVFMLPRAVHGPVIRFYLDCTGGLLRAELGGSTSIEAVARDAERAMPGTGDLVRSVLGGIADMHPDAADPASCSEISFAYTFEGVPARL